MPLKILHTSDWHIGKQLHKIDFQDDINLFFDWLIETIEQEKINLLLMSGDLFDQANPSQAALSLYYDFLCRMIPLNCRIILTGGNHDSPAVLNAPKELLHFLKIDVVGGAPETINELFFTYEFEDEKVVIAAVPFLRDKDIRKTIEGESYDDKIQQIKEGLANFFGQVNKHYSENFNGEPFVVMAHLFAQGVEISESERDIQIGNLAGIDAKIFCSEPNYVALGHIHKPQMLGNPMIRYSGSPISLSFSEKLDTKQVVVLTVENKEINLEILPIPKFRRLISFDGTLSEIQDKIANYKTTSPLLDLAEINVLEEKESLTVYQELEELQTKELENGLKIVNCKLEFANKILGSASFMSAQENVSDYRPEELFQKRLDMEETLENKADLILAFKEIMQQINETI